ncbi:MAG TPA: tryptophan synthase subunit alpha [Bacteroidota bacterium]|nr:tryptophan synthase subunit alpha [Bacteroidota bacterium]
MNLAKHLSDLKEHNRKILSVFVTCGYPTVEIMVPLINAIAAAGADLIELGIPFSDPIADGPVIQQSSQEALRNNVTLSVVFDVASQVAQNSGVPLVAMGYANPIYSFGLEQFFASCRRSGISGTIIPDIPFEDGDEYRNIAARNGIASVFLAAPTTSDKRLRMLDEVSQGFLYCVSITGVTGSHPTGNEQRDAFLRRARKCVSRNVLLAGFGIATPEDASRASALCDGVIIGSALVRILQNSPKNDIIQRAAQFVSSVRASLDH